MLQRKYKAKVESIEHPLPDIFTVTFSSEKRFLYKPGQFLHLTLDEYDGTGQWPESRCFSMQSSPEEEVIKITFSVKGKYTKRMAEELIVGKEVWIKLPYGDLFDRAHNKVNCVFIAGGTGITPFLSLFTDTGFSNYTNPKLYFGLRSSNYNFFHNELKTAKDINPGFNLELIYQEKIGLLDIEKIHSQNIDAIYFISGPPIMIKKFREYLLIQQIPINKIMTDDWE